MQIILWIGLTFLFRLIFAEPDKTTATYLCSAFGTMCIISTAIVPFFTKKIIIHNVKL